MRTTELDVRVAVSAETFSTNSSFETNDGSAPAVLPTSGGVVGSTALRCLGLTRPGGWSGRAQILAWISGCLDGPREDLGSDSLPIQHRKSVWSVLSELRSFCQRFRCVSGSSAIRQTHRCVLVSFGCRCGEVWLR